MEEKKYNFGEKPSEYPHGYGYCQCGCGKLAPRLTNGMCLHFISSHNPNKQQERRRSSIIVRRPKVIMNNSFRAKYRSERWSLKYERCVGCGTNEVPHWAHGYCNRCYPKFVIRKTEYLGREKINSLISVRTKIKKNLPVQISKVLNKELLEELYNQKHMSFGDIARVHNCSRAYVYRLCLKYGIKIKTKSKAREDAHRLGKKVRYHSVNKDFFRAWSNEMAYVLGFICADGNIGPRLDVLTIAQKEIDILEKIKYLMKAEQNITHYKHQDIHFLSIGSSEIVEDLLKLGITPYKSLKIKFPTIPSEYSSHFIRGNFDGDGSISFNSNVYGGNWRVSFLSGSLEFVKGIKENLESLAFVGKHDIHKHKDANAYNLYFHSKNDINRIFQFFYDNYTLEHGLYLNRKYNKFLEAIEFYKDRKGRKQ